jgi:hypothetical protein
MFGELQNLIFPYFREFLSVFFPAISKLKKYELLFEMGNKITRTILTFYVHVGLLCHTFRMDQDSPVRKCPPMGWIIASGGGATAVKYQYIIHHKICRFISNN